MSPSPASAFLALLAIALTFFNMSATAQFVTSYCSTQNTGSTDLFYWQWQSNGKCSDHCNALGTYAFAVIKYTDCWCSNYIPEQQTDTSECQVDCPGFPDNKCGDKDKGLYIYIKLAGSPSGTQGASKPTSASVSSNAIPLPSSTEGSSSPEVTTDTEPSSTMTTRTSAANNAPATEDAPITTPTVVTESGVVITRTVVVTPTSGAARTNQGGSNTGAIVGGAVGGVAGVLAIIGGILFLLWRRRKQQQEQGDGASDSLAGISRNVSTMSKAGLLGGRREKEPQYPSPVVTSFGSQRSRRDGDSISPITASDRRHSQPIMVDSRLNPRAVLTFHGNDSRESIGTIDDSRDYGRQLNVVNPDLSHRD
ncbi:hypothetical protein ACN47E_001343 [Coniothyrium glycines]